MTEPVDERVAVRRPDGLLGRVARALDAVFPATPEPTSGRRDLGLAVGVAAAVGALLIARAPFKFDHLWAEDGTVFLGGALNEGRLAAYDDWYAGYLHAVGRSVGAVAASLPLRLAPAVFFLAAVLVTAAGAGLVMHVSARYVERRWLRALLAAVPAVLPTMQVEAVGNVSNLQFLLVYFAFWLLLLFPRRWYTGVLATVATLVIALSTVLVVFLAPLALARLAARRGAGGLAPPLALVAGAAVQLVGGRMAGVERGDQGMVPLDLVGALDAFRALAGPNLHASVGDPAFDRAAAVLVLVSVVILLGVAFGATVRTSGRGVPPVVARTMVGLSLGTGAGIWLTLALAFGVATRYGVMVSLFLAAGLVVATDLALDAGPPALARVTSCLVLVAFALAVVRGWEPQAWHAEPGRAWSQVVDAAQTECRETGAEWALLPVSPTPWSVFLRCDEVLGAA